MSVHCFDDVGCLCIGSLSVPTTQRLPAYVAGSWVGLSVQAEGLKMAELSS